MGIYAPTVKLISALKVAEIAKKLNKITLLGGPHPTIRPKEVISNKYVDAIIVGEGEAIFPKVINDLLTKDHTNIIYQHNFIEDVNKIEFPARHKLLDKYSENGYGHIITARGCPFACTYCGSQSIWKRKIRARSINNVIVMKHLY